MDLTKETILITIQRASRNKHFVIMKETFMNKMSVIFFKKFYLTDNLSDNEVFMKGNSHKNDHLQEIHRYAVLCRKKQTQLRYCLFTFVKHLSETILRCASIRRYFHLICKPHPLDI